MRKRYSLLFLMLILFASSLTSCYDATEIDDSIYAIVIGLDKGTTDKIRVTIQYPTYKEGSGGGSPGQSKEGGDVTQENRLENSNVHSMEASSVLEAVNMFNTAITRTTSLAHSKMLVISEELAREGIEPLLAPLARYREVRRTMQVVISRENADEFIRQNKTNIGPSTSKAAELMIVQAATTGYFPKISFDELYASILSPYSEAVASYAGINEFKNLDEEKSNKKTTDIERGIFPGEAARIGVTKREFIGSAVFYGPKMVGALDSKETRVMLMIQNKFRNGIMSFKDKRDPNLVIPCDVRLGRKTRITSKFENGKPVINVKLNVEADVGSIQSRINYEDIGLIEEVNNTIKDEIQKMAYALIKKTQNEYKSDIFGFGFDIAKKFKTIQEFDEYNWMSKYPEAIINVDVTVNIRRTGLMIKSAQVPKHLNEKESVGDK